MRKPRKHGDDIRAAATLVVSATTGVTGVVEDMHRTIASGPAVLGRPFAAPARLWTRAAYGHVRVVTRLVGRAIDLVLEQIAPLLGESTPGPEREAVLAVLNGVLGDYLAEIESPLAIEMSSRLAGDRTPKMLVLVHGSSMADHQWTRRGHDHGAALARDLAVTPVYVRYNSGLHISTNGRALAEHLESIIEEWPASEIAIVGHSMGGLVARSACNVAEAQGLAWRKKLRALVCLGSPHHGSPLERGGNWIDALLGVSAYSAPLARLAAIRSAGVTDLRFGNVLDEHWDGIERFDLGSDLRRPLPLPADVECFAVAGTTAKEMRPKLPGDRLVPVDSALGRHAKEELTLRFPEPHCSIALGTGHLDLLDRAEVYDTIRAWLAAALR